MRIHAALLLLLAIPCGRAAADADEVVLLGERQRLRVELRPEVNGKPLADVWETAFRTLFANLDRDGNGTLDRAEAARAPAAVRVRQLSWGYFFAHPGDAPPWAELAGADDARSVSRDRLAAYYRRCGVGPVQVSVGVAPGTEALTRALLRRLDRDGDGTVAQTEWQDANKLLKKLDLNEDEVLTPDELVAGILYPGVQGGTLLTPSSATVRPAAARLPLLRLPFRGEGTRTAEELAGERTRPADAVLTLRLGPRGDRPALVWQKGDTRLSADAGERLEAGVEGLRMTLGVGEASFGADFEAARKTAAQRFTEADGNGDGVLDRAEATRSTYGPLRTLFDAADRNGEGRVSRKEWDGWLNVLASLTAGQVVLAVVDQGRGLYELLDADRDGRLSLRELRGAWARVKDSGSLEGKTLRPERLPRRLLAAVAVGSPHQPPPLRRRAGPAWFRAADRNSDGDVSLREFVGTVEDFRRADADGDGLIDAAEAERVTKKNR